MSYNEKQVQIIEAAEVLFAEKGFEGTSVRDIAEAAGINIAMISYYFGSKEKLMEALFDLRTGHVAIKLESMLADESISPVEKMERLIDEHIEKAGHRHLFYRIMVTEQLINKNSFITVALRDLKRKNLERITKLVNEGQQKGLFKKDINVWMMINTLMGAISHAVMNKDAFKEVHGLEDKTEEEVRQILKSELSTHLKELFKSILINEA